MHDAQPSAVKVLADIRNTAIQLAIQQLSYHDRNRTPGPDEKHSELWKVPEASTSMPPRSRNVVGEESVKIKSK